MYTQSKNKSGILFAILFTSIIGVVYFVFTDFKFFDPNKKEDKESIQKFTEFQINLKKTNKSLSPIKNPKEIIN
jgi:hypothetical protein